MTQHDTTENVKKNADFDDTTENVLFFNPDFEMKHDTTDFCFLLFLTLILMTQHDTSENVCFCNADFDDTA